MAIYLRDGLKYTLAHTLDTYILLSAPNLSRLPAFNQVLFDHSPARISPSALSHAIMHTVFAAALAGIFAGASALQTDSIARIDKPENIERGNCQSLDPCKYAPPGSYALDPKTFFLPNKGNERTNQWSLCKDSPYCKDYETFSKVSFDFKDDALVFEFENIAGCNFDDVEIQIQREYPPTEASPKFSLKHGNCKTNYNGGLSCYLSYRALNCNGYEDMCPAKDEGGWVFYAKIKATVNLYGKRVELYSKAIEKDACWFSLSYCCTKCSCNKGHESQDKHLPQTSHHEQPQHQCHDKCSKPCPEKPEHTCHPGCPQKCPDKPCYQKQHECQDQNCYHHKPQSSHWSAEQAQRRWLTTTSTTSGWSSTSTGWSSTSTGWSSTEISSSCTVTQTATATVSEVVKPTCHKCHKHGPDCSCYAGTDALEFACEDIHLVIFGRKDGCIGDHHQGQWQEFYPGYGHCNEEIGHYHKCLRYDMDVRMSGNVALNQNRIGYFFIEFERKNKDDVYILFDISTTNADFYFAQAAVFADCQETTRFGHPNDNTGEICKPETWPNWYANEKGTGDFQFRVLDEWKCPGDYVFGIWAKICVADDSQKCSHQRIML